MRKIEDKIYKFKLLRQLPTSVRRETNGMPIINKCEVDVLNDTQFVTFTNSKYIKEPDKSIVLFFEYDYTIDRVWDNPFKYLPRFSKLKAITTPDYSIYGEMDKITILHNTYRNRWVGCWYQQQGLKVIPTISWAYEDTYDICFSGIEKGSIVCISTIGCMKKHDVFLKGYNEMLKRIEPSLIIIKGRKIPNLKGNILWVPFDATFNHKKKGEK